MPSASGVDELNSLEVSEWISWTVLGRMNESGFVGLRKRRARHTDFLSFNPKALI